MRYARLIAKNQKFDSAAFKAARRELIEKDIKSDGFPTAGAEISILRKQIASILKALSDNRINAEILEFSEYNRMIESLIDNIDSALDINDEGGPDAH